MNTSKRWDQGSTSSPSSDGLRLTEDHLLSHATSSSPDDPIKRLWGTSEKRNRSESGSKRSIESVYEPKQPQARSSSTSFQDAFEMETHVDKPIHSKLPRVFMASEAGKARDAAQCKRPENSPEQTPLLAEKTGEELSGSNAIGIKTGRALSRRTFSKHTFRITPTPGQQSIRADKQSLTENAGNATRSLFSSTNLDAMLHTNLELQVAGVHHDRASPLVGTAQTSPATVEKVVDPTIPEATGSSPSFHDLLFGVHDELATEEFTMEELKGLELGGCEDIGAAPLLQDALFVGVNGSGGEMADYCHRIWRQWMASAATLALVAPLLYRLFLILDEWIEERFDSDHSIIR